MIQNQFLSPHFELREFIASRKAIAIKDGVSSSVTSRTYSKVEGGGDDEPGGDDH